MIFRHFPSPFSKQSIAAIGVLTPLHHCGIGSLCKKKKEEITRILSPPQTLAAEFNSLKFERRRQMEGATVCCVLWLDAMETEQRRLLLCVCTALQKSDEIGMCLASSHCLRVCFHFIWHRYTQHHHLSLPGVCTCPSFKDLLIPCPLSVQLGNI